MRRRESAVVIFSWVLRNSSCVPIWKSGSWPIWMPCRWRRISVIWSFARRVTLAEAAAAMIVSTRPALLGAMRAR